MDQAFAVDLARKAKRVELMMGAQMREPLVRDAGPAEIEKPQVLQLPDGFELEVGATGGQELYSARR